MFGESKANALRKVHPTMFAGSVEQVTVCFVRPLSPARGPQLPASDEAGGC